MKNVTIALIQSKVSKDIRSNVAKTVKLIGQAAGKGAEIIALQELFQTPYFPQWEKKEKDDYAESVKGYTVSEMRKAAKKFGVTLVMMPLAFSITEGISFGVISYVLLKVVSGRGKRVHWLLYLFAVLFVARYIWLK